MAVESVSSPVISNANASPRVLNSVRQVGGRLRSKTATVAVGALASIGSTYRFVRVRSNDHLRSIKLFTTAITGAIDADVGLYGINGGAAVDADVYANGISLADAAPAVPPVAQVAAPLECRFADALTANLSDAPNAVWQDLGLAEDPGLEYDLTLTLNVAGIPAGVVTIQVEYVSGD